MNVLAGSTRSAEPDQSEMSSSHQLNHETTFLQSLKADENFVPFFAQKFDDVEYVSRVVRENQAESSLTKLKTGVSKLDQEINSQVATHYGKLLTQVNNLNDVQQMLDTVKMGVGKLEASIQSLKRDLTEPYLTMKTRTEQAQRVFTACELLRKVLRFLLVSQNLKAHLANGVRELPKAAQCLYELETIRRECDLSGIEVVDCEVEWILKSREEVLNNSSRLLVQGMETQNQADVANSLQVFFNLKMLEQKVAETLKSLENRMKGEILENLKSIDLMELSKRQDEAVWIRFEKLVDKLYTLCVHVWHLQRVTSKMRDTNTHRSFLNMIKKDDEDTPSLAFWKKGMQSIAEQLYKSADEYEMLEQLFISGYPRLIGKLNNLLERLQTHHDMKAAKLNTSMVVEKAEIRKALHKFENAFLSSSLNTLFEPIGIIFPAGARSAPSPDEVVKFIKVLQRQLQCSTADQELNLLLHKGVAKALSLFTVRSEAMVATSNDAYQVTEAACTPSQVRNAMIFNALSQLSKYMEEAIQSLPNSSQEVFKKPQASILGLSEQILEPLFTQFYPVVERSLMALHDEDFSRPTAPHTQSESQYMKLLQHQVLNFQSVILSPFTSCTGLQERKQNLAEHIVVFFLRQVCLVRPLSDAGKLKIAADAVQLESAVSSIVPLKDISKAHRMLKSLRPLLFRDADKIQDSLESDVMLPSMILHHLFGRAPLELRSPHQCKGWSLAQYSQWLDTHSEQDIWILMKEALAAYATSVDARGLKEYSPLYPIILSLGPELLKRYSERKH